MPLAGKGMLLTSMDIDSADEAEFNRWYDHEHLEERVAIDGFLEARRYVAHQTSLIVRSVSVSVDGSVEKQLHVTQEAFPKYFCLYSTTTIDVLDSPTYKSRLANPTEWSKKTMALFKNMIRAVARITISRGQGRGAALGIVRFRSATGEEDRLRAALREALDPLYIDGVISMHLIESDPVLSKPLTNTPSASNPSASDWFALIDATDVNAASAAVALLVDGAPFRSAVISAGIYRLMWDLAKSDIPA
jgi:hypothetical protein